MAKSPAFNFYSADFDIGTKFFTDDEVGKYIRLMCTQHQQGHLTLDEMEFICKGPVPLRVMEKYVQDENGKYYNKRLDEVIGKKKDHVEALRENLGKYYGKSRAEIAVMKAAERELIENPVLPDEAIPPEIPVKEATEAPSTKREKKKPQEKSREPVILKPPTLEEVEKYFIDNQFPVSLAKRAWAGYQENNWIDSQGNEIKNWKLKMQQVWFKEEHKVKTVIDRGQHPGQIIVDGSVPASFKK